jgi:thiol-disulfide isomerase/thioredoxin
MVPAYPKAAQTEPPVVHSERSARKGKAVAAVVQSRFCVASVSLRKGQGMRIGSGWLGGREVRLDTMRLADGSAPDAVGRSSRSTIRRRGLVQLAALAAAVASVSGTMPATALPSATPDTPAKTPASVMPVVEATAADVLKAVRSARGNVVLVNIWATWCDPCRHEFPALLKVRREFAAQGFKLILVSADFPDQRPKVVQFLTQQGVRFTTFLKDENDMAFINALDPKWSGALPVTFLYGRSGKLSDFWEGESTYPVLAAKLRALLGSRSGQGGSKGGSQ